MPRFLPDPPPTPFGGRCSRRPIAPGQSDGAPCGKPRIHMGSGPGDVWLCAYCDSVTSVEIHGPPRLLRYIESGDRS